MHLKKFFVILFLFCLSINSAKTIENDVVELVIVDEEELVLNDPFSVAKESDVSSNSKSNSEFFFYDPESCFIVNTFLEIKNSNRFFYNQI